MLESELREILKQGFSDVSAVLDETLSTLAADPILDHIASLIEDNPNSRAVEPAVLSVLDSEDFSAAAEITQYLAHRFRWAWLEREVMKRSLVNSDLRRARFYERALEAFSDDWEDLDLFPSLTAGGERSPTPPGV